MLKKENDKMSSLRIPFIKSDRTTFFIVFAAGFALCMPGISQAPVHGWTHPISLAGILFGITAIFLAGSVFFRRYAGPIKNDRAAIFALLAILAIKFLLAALYPLIS